MTLDPAAAADTRDTGVSSNPVPGLTTAVAMGLGDLAHGTSGSSKKDSLPISTPTPAAALLGKTPVPDGKPELSTTADNLDNVAIGSAWDE